MADFNRTCPACTADGIPRAVTAQGGRFMVTLACGKCGRKWTTERKPDIQLFQTMHPGSLHTP